ncbi:MULTISPECIES: DoxX family protein [Ramlibacter]|uniref:DoxX family protein n=1 Tax=Ramlibacter pinisoli TaxID=2682844 RepID=A0A6N8J073_9BURK|nr:MULTISPECIES: DoxX family protein [Ramlibacter]MBA2961700.1 DoxX family protein [Ramlibacter sp. CGMCC 1.13660]MVQ31643.1 DoxX family protein [Ramlibacter pinisoli]
MNTGASPLPGPWRRRTGIALTVLVLAFFAMDALGKLLQVEPVLRGTAELGWPVAAVFPLGLLLALGALLYAIPRTCILGAIILTAFLGGAVASHYRVGSPLATHVLFGVYVGVLMWAALALRYPALVRVLRAPGREAV